MSRFIRLGWVLALGLALAACGGGGGGGSDGSGGGTTPPPPDPDPVPMGEKVASRFLAQATFGPTLPEIQALAARSNFDAWFSAQRSAAVSQHYGPVVATAAAGAFIEQNVRIERWFRNAVQGPDQLRQRMAFALSEIMVVSDVSSSLESQTAMLAAYYDVLSRNALGNYRTLLEDVTLSQAMGHYLSMFQNQKPDPANGIRSDENYAREVMQLFTIGLENLNADGTGRGTPTYTQADIENLARVFTGWGPPGGREENDFYFVPNAPVNQPMQGYTSFHDQDPKTIVGGVALLAGQTPQQDLDVALDTLFNHPNVGPFIGRQLIQRLVTSNPSPAYVARVAAVFDNNGSGVRGDLYAVAKAILTDVEALSGSTGRPQNFGKLREPLLRVTQLWRCFSGIGRDGRTEFLNPEVDLAQAPLRSPSVFNFFRPRYRPTGLLADAGLVGPEFQITNETTITSSTNAISYLAGIYRASSGATVGDYAARFVSLDFRPWESRAADVGGLIADLDLVLMGGTMPEAMRLSLVDYVTQVPATNAAERVYEAVNLIIGSPQYAVQR